MDQISRSFPWEIIFYLALTALVVLFLVKKYRQARNAEKENLKNNHNQ